MNNWIWIVLAAALCGAGAPRLRAEDPPAEKRPTREEMEKRMEDWKKLSPEEREAKRKEIKERLEKRIAALRSKQTNETITAQETNELVRSEKILKRFEQNGPPPRGERPKTDEPAAPAPK